MSDTPRTDSAEPYGPPYNGEESGLIHVPKAFARQLERELTRIREDRDLEKQMRKDQADRAESWKECAEKLASHVPGVSDEDCEALAVFEKLKGVEK